MTPPFKIIISPEAAADIQTIHEYIAQDSPRNAAMLVERILAGIESLAYFPHRNIAAEPKKQGRAVRSLPILPYVVYFRVDDDRQALRILTVRHGARRAPKRFK